MENRASCPFVQGGGEGGGGESAEATRNGEISGISGIKVKSDPSSYRPISLLPVVSKLIEKAIQYQIVSYMNTSLQWNSNNHAYKQRHSTTTTLLEMTDLVYQACDERAIAVIMGVDQTAAFDSVEHTLLYKKLQLYNFDDSTIAWIKTYLENRSQYVVVGAHNSPMKPVISGVPQGSVLGPVLYTIFLNELPDIVNEYNTCNDTSHTPSPYLFGKNCNLWWFSSKLCR